MISVARTNPSSTLPDPPQAIHQPNANPCPQTPNHDLLPFDPSPQSDPTYQIQPDELTSKYFIDYGEELIITVGYKALSPVKHGKFTWVIEYDNASTSIIELHCSFEGAILKIHQAEINFGIMKSWTSRAKTFEIENINDVDTEVLIKLQDNKEVNYELLDEAMGDVDADGEVVGMRTIEYLYNTGKVRIYPIRLDLPGKSKRNVTVEFVSEEPESFYNCLLIEPKYAETKLIQVHAEIQNPHIGLNRTKLEYNQLFANKVYTIKDPSDPKSIILRNMGNIPANFEWEDCSNSEIIQTVLVPNKGVIDAKSDIHIKFKFVVKLFGKFSFFFKCRCDVLDIPIGFELKADVYGLDISYELPPGPSPADL